MARFLNGTRPPRRDHRHGARNDGADVLIPGISGEDAKQYLSAASADDPFPLYWSTHAHGRISYRRPEDGQDAHRLEARIVAGPDNAVFLRHDEIGIDPVAISAELARRIARGKRILNQEDIVNAVMAMPAAEFRIERFIMTAPNTYTPPSGVLADLGSGISVVASQRTVSLFREGCPVFSLAIYGHKAENPKWVPRGPKDCMHLNMMARDAGGFAEPVRTALGSEGLSLLGSLWVEAVLAGNPDFDAAAYREPDVHRLLIDAEREDAGYTF